jgi:hypothetical protein
MSIPPRPARVFIVHRSGQYFVDRFALANSARNGWVVTHKPGGTGYASIRALKAVELPSFVDAGFYPVTFRIA